MEWALMLLRFREQPIHSDIGLISQRRLEQHALPFQRRSIYDLGEENAYDYAICSEVIEYVEDPIELLNNVCSAIRKFAIITNSDGPLPGPLL